MDFEYWLRLGNARNLSPVVCTRLLNHFGGPRAVCHAGVAELLACGVKPAVIAELQQPDATLLASQHRWAQQPQQYILTRGDERYPVLLNTIADPPPVLFVRGDPAVLSQPQLAMVGSRNPSPGGLKAAEAFAAALVSVGLVITSGLAVGIDGASHRGALSGGGATIAVLGSGLSRIYPARHERLALDIAAQGALVSEFSPDVPPLASHFPRRNRIISGLSCGTCVVEAAVHSGSLITAKLAAEQGREVFAVPGSIYNPLTSGCHTLIQEGAKLVASVTDILTELQCGGLTQWRAKTLNPSAPPQPELDDACRQLLPWVGFETTTVDQLVQRTGRPAAQVMASLLVLTLQGYIYPTPGGYCRT